MAEQLIVTRVKHVLRPDGLELTSIAELNNGHILTTKVGWKDLATAQASYEIAKAQFELQAPDFAKDRVSGDKRRCKRFGNWFITVYTGPPTWWLPKAGISWSKRRVRFGWLRGAVSITRPTR